ncbi:MAG: hypothetical protein HY445_00690 [Candidatus Niyogibacteria bacterium]|nr:hypothetical protein [Candidatus Niyogibacteria bacterium]
MSDAVSDAFLSCFRDKGVIKITDKLRAKYRELTELYTDFTFECSDTSKTCAGLAKDNRLIISVFRRYFQTQCEEEAHFLGFSHADFKNPEIEYCLQTCQYYDGTVIENSSLETEKKPDDFEKEIVCEEIESKERDWIITTPSHCEK